VKPADLRTALPAQLVLDKVGRWAAGAARRSLVRSGAAAGVALVAVSAASAATSVVRRRTATR
jgi:hypothetical protein